MTVEYDIVVRGNNLRLKDDFLGIANVTLIRSAGGPLLFDTGGYVSRLGLVKALKDRGLEPEDIRLVFLSHLHFDHSHNIDLFRRAKVLVSRAEWDYAGASHPKDLFMPWGIHEQLAKHDLELIDGEGMLDNGLSFYPVPGHTPGCYALELMSDKYGRVVVAGDAIKYAKEAVARCCDTAFDTIEHGTESICKILDRADRIVPGHFQELIRQKDGAFGWQDMAPFELYLR
jgi:glyoxylase-like metal-dependent hydrolase (beta-lactamase superfamily II)